MNENNEHKPILETIKKSFSHVFHLWSETDKLGTLTLITEAVEFKGSNVWSLIIAIFIASIGLNINSPAVIIGAMLISPLMGPIMGAGLAIGIYDTQLFKRSLFNLLLMTLISLITSFVYFTFSPLHQTTSEIMARTTPTFFDVMIALLGGTAMIISVSRKSRSTNAIAGVAIATALMPPLCTAGFGLATKNINIFAGAFYLYLINTIFIGLTTLIFTKYLRLSDKVDLTKKGISKRKIALFSLITIIFLAPSIYMGYDLIQLTAFQSKVDRFIVLNMNFPNTQVSNVIKKKDHEHSTIQVALSGEPISEEMITHLQSQLSEFGLGNTELKIIQTEKNIHELKNSENELKNKTSQLNDRNSILQDVSKEISILFPEINSFSWGDMLVTSTEQINPQKKYTVLVKWNDSKNLITQQTKLMLYLKIRLHLEDLNLVVIQ